VRLQDSRGFIWFGTQEGLNKSMFIIFKTPFTELIKEDSSKAASRGV